MRKLILALSLWCTVALGQSPPPVPALPDASRITPYTLAASTCACSVGFGIYADNTSTDVDNWVQVWISSAAGTTATRYLSTDSTFGWKLTSATGTLALIPRPVTDAVLTFNSPQTGYVVILGAQRPRRNNEFTENRGVSARDHNQVLNTVFAEQRETWDKLNGAIIGQPGEVMARLPAAATRANQNLIFDGSGNPTVSSAIPTNTFANVTVTGSFTATGLVTNADLANASTTVNSQACTLGSTCTVPAVTALTGDVTASGSGSVASTLATVNANVGSFGSATAIPNLTVNAKGLVTAAGSSALVVTLPEHATQAANTIVANATGGVAAPTAATPSAVIDSAIGSTQGSILYRGASAWTALGPGTSGQVLQTQGAAANPQWAAAGGGSLVLLNTVTASASAAMTDTTSLTGTYTNYLVVLSNVITTGSSVSLTLQLQSGGTFKTTNYISTFLLGTSVGTTSGSNTTFIPLTGTGNLLNTGAPGFSGSFIISNPSVSSLVFVTGTGSFFNTGTTVATSQFAGFWNTAAVITGFQVLANANTIASGVMKVYGML